MGMGMADAYKFDNKNFSQLWGLGRRTLNLFFFFLPSDRKRTLSLGLVPASVGNLVSH